MGVVRNNSNKAFTKTKVIIYVRYCDMSYNIATCYNKLIAHLVLHIICIGV